MHKWILFITAVLFVMQVRAELPLPLPENPPGSQQPNPPPSERPPAGQPLRYTLGVADLSRFQDDEFAFYPRADFNEIYLLSISGLVNNSIIKEVRIQHADNFDEVFDYILPGDLSAGGTRTVSLDRRPIYRIIVKATSAYFWKKPGSFRLDAAAYPKN